MTSSGRAENAAFVGAKTVKGPACLSKERFISVKIHFIKD
jgi:hypothetical protein